MGVTYCVGPLAACLADKFGLREMVIGGAVIAATSLILSGAAVSGIVSLYASAGVFTGNCNYGPSFLEKGHFAFLH